MEEQQELKLDFKISAKPAVSVSSVKLPKFSTVNFFSAEIKFSEFPIVSREY